MLWKALYKCTVRTDTIQQHKSTAQVKRAKKPTALFDASPSSISGVFAVVCKTDPRPLLPCHCSGHASLTDRTALSVCAAARVVRHWLVTVMSIFLVSIIRFFIVIVSLETTETLAAETDNTDHVRDKEGLETIVWIWDSNLLTRIYWLGLRATDSWDQS